MPYKGVISAANPNSFFKIELELSKDGEELEILLNSAKGKLILVMSNTGDFPVYDNKNAKLNDYQWISHNGVIFLSNRAEKPAKQKNKAKKSQKPS